MQIMNSRGRDDPEGLSHNVNGIIHDNYGPNINDLW